MNDAIDNLQLQLDRLTGEVRDAQDKIRKMERQNAATLIILIAATALCISSWTAKASERETSPTAPGATPETTRVKAPFEVVDEQGRVIMRVRDGDDRLDRGAYVFNESGRSIVGLSSSSDSGGGGKVKVTAAGAETNSEGDQATGVTITGLRQSSGIQINRDAKKAVLITSDQGDMGKVAGGSIQVFNSAEKAVAVLDSQKDGGSLKLNNSAGKILSSLDTQKDGGSLKLYNSANKAEATIDALSDGGSLKIFDSTNKNAATMESTKTGGTMTVFGADGKKAVGLETSNDGGSLSVFGKDEKAVGILKSDAGDGKLSINDKDGKVVASVLASDNGGIVKVSKSGDEHTSTSINAIESGLGLMVRKAGAKFAFVGAAGTTSEVGTVYVYAGSDDPVAGLSSTGGRGVVSVYHQAIPIAFLTESDKHPGGGSVTVTDPGGNGMFSAGYTGEGGDACVNRKNGLKCLGIALPLQIN